ncbi:MAG: IS4 family transposase [Bryobacteraceae bacterium]
MAFPDLFDVFRLYQQVAPAGVLEYLQLQAGQRPRSGIYSLAVVFWLMIVQRLQPNGTLASTVQHLVQGIADPLLANCKRVRERKISPRTGGYCQARQKMPTLVAERVTEEIVERLRQQISEPFPGLDRAVFLLDGSSLQLEHSRDLVRAYPPGGNQHGPNHWPLLRIVVLHDVGSGLAQRPYWGPLNGPQAVSEQALAEQAIAALPSGAVVMGDRNFGIFSVAHAAQQSDHPMVLRLTDVRARKLGGCLSQAGAYPVVWKPSRWDGKKKQGNKDQGWPPKAAVSGWLIAWRIGRGKSKSWLYLFSTVELSAAEVVKLYGRRWNIETDLRSLKRTVRLHHLTSQTVDTMEKELLVAVSAYNLVRAVMCLAARRSGIDPRQLSFTQVLNVVNCAWPRLMAASTMQEHHREFERVLDLAALCTLPKRRKRRSYPREVWGRGFHFPTRKTGKTK